MKGQSSSGNILAIIVMFIFSILILGAFGLPVSILSFLIYTGLFAVDLIVILSIFDKYKNHKSHFWTFLIIRTILLIICFTASDSTKLIANYINHLEALFFIPAIFYLFNNKNKFNFQDTFSKTEPNGDDKVMATINDYDQLFKYDEKTMVKEWIKRELKESNIKYSNKLPFDALKRKLILSIIFPVLVFIYVSMIFFHFPFTTYLIGLIILLILFVITVKYTLIKYLIKQVKARPNEKISNIIMNTSSLLQYDYTRILRFGGSLLAIILALIIFKNPVILYEPYEDGYAVRYYAYGYTNYKTATIPAVHNGKPVLSLRGNTFSNMSKLETVTLPDSIVEIRGQAFLNDTSLVSVKLPANLKYLGGGAFYNVTSLKEIELPDSLTELGGESFYNAISLEYVKLSNNLQEIKGNTFENCYNLKEITIPDSVTRIGGHAFYANYELKNVYISENSKLTEIGSSAFRLCNKLDTIHVPSKTSINSKAFKDSPTRVIRY